MEQANIDGTTIIIVMILLLVGFFLLIWGLILEGKYNGPYTLISTPKGEKWKRAAIVAVLQTNIILAFGGLIFYNNDVSSNLQKLIMLAMCSGAWILLVIILALSKRWQWEILLNNYKRMDQSIKNGTYQKIYGSPLFSWTRIFLGSEMKRFGVDGYSEDMLKSDEGNKSPGIRK